MEAFEKIRAFLDDMSETDFYKYLSITLGVIGVLALLIVVQFYRGISNTKQQITLIEDQRIEAKKILSRAELVKKQREEVDSMLAKDGAFKIGGYFKDLLIKLNLTGKQVSLDISPIDHGEYRESILKAKLTDMNMKELCDLLNELDQNKRIFTKELEILKSTKTPKTIDVNLTIATLEPKIAQVT